MKSFKKFIGLVLVSTILLTSCSSRRNSSIVYPQMKVINNLTDAEKSPQNLANYYMYTILRGQYADAWNLTSVPNDTVFNYQLFQQKYKEMGFTTFQEDILPYGDAPDSMLANVNSAKSNSSASPSSASSASSSSTSAVSSSKSSATSSSASSSSSFSTAGQAVDFNTATTLANSSVKRPDSSYKVGDFTYPASVQAIAPKMLDDSGNYVSAFRNCISIYSIAESSPNNTNQAQTYNYNLYTVTYGNSNNGVPTGSWQIAITGSNPGDYRVLVPSQFLSTYALSIKVPNGVKIQLDGADVSQTLVDNNNYYQIPKYPSYDKLNLTMLSATCPPVTQTIAITDPSAVQNARTKILTNANNVSTVSDKMNLFHKLQNLPASSPNVFSFEWAVDKQDRDSAISFIQTSLQSVVNSILKFENPDTTTFGGTLSQNADRKNFEPALQTVENDIKNSETYQGIHYKSISLMQIGLVDDSSLTGEKTLNDVVSYNEVQIWVNLSVYITETVGTSATIVPITNQVQTYVRLTKDNGQWKFADFDGGFFRVLESK